MNITSLGHAGFLIEANGVRILCDPWFTPAYFASWFPFPRNDHLDPWQLGDITHLYISHLHKDHFDSSFLTQYVSKNAIILLPVFPLPSLETELRGLGFTKILYCNDGETTHIGNGVSITIHTYTTPTDGGTGDSCLLVDDNGMRVLHLNDAHPEDPTALLRQGPIDLLMLQFSGASWYPIAYDVPMQEKLLLCKLKRNNQFQRALRYIQKLAPKYIVPCAGPACFLDDDLFHLNDLDNNPSRVFADQRIFLDFLKRNQINGGHLMLPGSSAFFDSKRFNAKHMIPNREINDIFYNKQAYLKSYQESRRSEIQDHRNSWGDKSLDLLSTLQEWWEPLLRQANKICAGVNGNVVLDVGSQQILIDFPNQKVRSWRGEPWTYNFQVERNLIETCVKQRLENWPADLFLSLRFKVRRRSSYNECVYAFFRCLSSARIEYFERNYRAYSSSEEMCSINGYRFQRFCPHMKVDLQSFGSIQGKILTCTRHGWQFNLETGECLTTKSYCLKVESKINE